MNIIIGKKFTAPPARGEDGIGHCDGQPWRYRSCYIDMRSNRIADIDEAVGITWGSSAIFEKCVIRGAAKLFLCGCGDDPSDPHVRAELGKRVILRECVLMDFVRRGPEVQDGMIVEMYDSLVCWGSPDHFADDGLRGWLTLPMDDACKWQRVFGAWAHNGGAVFAQSCVFLPTYDAPLWQRIISRISHFGQAINERGFLRGMFHRDAWLSGYKRALTSGPKGYVEAYNCYAPKGYLIENHTDPMSEYMAMKKVSQLKKMERALRMVCR